MIETIVLSGVNAAQSRLLRSCRETSEVPRHPRQYLRSDIESGVVAKIESQHFCACTTGGAVSASIGRVWCSLGSKRKPIGIIIHFGRSNRPLQLIKVLRIEEGDHRVGQPKI